MEFIILQQRGTQVGMNMRSTYLSKLEMLGILLRFKNITLNQYPLICILQKLKDQSTLF